MSRILVSDEHGNVARVPRATFCIYESLGYEIITEEVIKAKEKALEAERLLAYAKLKLKEQELQTADLNVDEWDAVEENKEEIEVEDTSIIVRVETNPISELTLNEIREYGVAKGIKKLAEATRTDGARRALERYLDEIEGD